MDRKIEPTTCVVNITSYKASGKFYHRETATVTFNSNYPMLDSHFDAKIITNNGLIGQMPITTFEWVGGKPVAFLMGAIIEK